MTELFEKISDNEPVAILLLGKGGTGKSSIASCLSQLLAEHGYATRLIRFDELRKSLAPRGTDPFSQDIEIKNIIYENAVKEFSHRLDEGITLVIDSGLSVESIRQMLKDQIPRLRIIHVTCPLFVSIWRDTWRSLLRKEHERGSFLYLRAIVDRFNPLKKYKFPQPGITYPFEYPLCADMHVQTFFNSPANAAREIIKTLEL